MPQFNMNIAGLVAHVDARFDSTPYYLARYATEDPCDFYIPVSHEDLERERYFRDAEALEEGMKPRAVSDPFLERLVIQRKFAEAAMERNVLLVHGSAVAVNGVGYIFTAGCGTGKSTHTRLWRQVFGDRVVMINDDKPFISMSNDGIFVCGSPWSGKHGLDTNVSVPLGGICLLERGAENHIASLEHEKIPQMIDRLRWYMEAERISQFDALAMNMLKQIPLWHLWCNMDPDAAKISHQAMSGR